MGTPALSWRDLLVIVRQSPTGTALDRALRPEESHWSTGDYLSAQAVDALNWLVWAKSADAEHNRNKPEPTPRPEAARAPAAANPDALPFDEATRRLGWGQTEGGDS